MSCKDCNNIEEEVLLLLALQEDAENLKRKRRNIWVHEINSVHEADSEFSTLYPMLRLHEEKFYTYFRMSYNCFDEILELIRNDITKKDTNYRESISPVERLAVALRFLATGDTYKTIGLSFRLGFSTVSQIVEEVCDAIWKRLQPIYMPEPTTEMWEQSMLGFSEKWGFPNCLGSIDGKHVTVKCPKGTGSNYYCYLNKFSIVLMAIAGPDYKFTCIDVGGYGKNSDGGIFETSAMGKRISNNTLNIPADRPLPNGSQPTPCVLIGDEAFALTPFLMRPFPYRQSRQDIQKETFNKALCAARRVVENAFGILTQKWRVFHRPLEVKIETAIKIVQAACILHNFLIRKKSDAGFEHLINIPETSNAALSHFSNCSRRPPAYAFEIRERFVNHFNINQ